MPGRSTHSSSRRAAELADSDVDAPEHATSPGEQHGTSRQVFNQDDVDIANYKNASSASGNANVGATTIRQPIAAHPQLCIIETPLVSADLSSFNHCPRHMHTEYRIYNWRRLLSGRIIRGDETEKDLLVWAVVAGIAYLLRNVSIELWRCVGEGEVLGTGQVALSNRQWAVLAALAMIWVKLMTSTVLYQSVVPLPHLGIQLSTTRGLSLPPRLSFRVRPPHRQPVQPIGDARLKPPIDPTGGRFYVALSTSHTFIPLQDISTVIINEGLTRWNVRYYLGIVRTGGKGVDVAYDQLRQPARVLREVYHGVRETLFDEYSCDDPDAPDE